MLILLPPSEKKRTPETSPALDLAALSFELELLLARKSLIERHDELNLATTGLAISIYSGVLYQALDWFNLDAASMKRGQNSIVIISALFGALRPLDLIPNYKLKISTSHWKVCISAALQSLDSELIVDARSSTYASVWTPPTSKTVAVRVYEIRNGEKKVITHMSKRTRGEVARLLICENRMPKTPEEVFEIVKKNYQCELIAPANGKSWFIDVIAG